MADYLLDTNILAYWYNPARPEHEKVIKRIDLARQPDPETGYVSRLLISSVTWGEIEYGHSFVPPPKPSAQEEYRQFVRVQCPEVINVDKHVAEQYGEMKAWLFEKFSPNRNKKAKWPEQLIEPAGGRELGIDENDLWIAAQALTHNLVLVTNDSKANFQAVLKQFAPRLAFEMWAR